MMCKACYKELISLNLSLYFLHNTDSMQTLLKFQSILHRNRTNITEDFMEPQALNIQSNNEINEWSMIIFNFKLCHRITISKILE